jgi:hypothetical protein
LAVEPAVSRGTSRAQASATRLVCLFHLNLAFSSLEEDRHAEVVRRCYRPALELAAQAGFPIAVEATGWTLRRIAELDPGWIRLARGLLADGRIELVGSAHAQCAAPLLPAEVNAWNLRLGRAGYRELLGVSPRIALVCEQVFSPGLVPLYLQAGYQAIVVDWDNAYRSHPEWPSEYRRHPQRAVGGGSSIPIVWSESIAFQKFQRFAHRELSLERYLDYVREVAHGADGAPGEGRRNPEGEPVGAAVGRVLMLYANDVEIFDHRPGRFAAEPDLQEGEWQRIAEGLRGLRERGLGVPALPSGVLDLLDLPGTGRELALESAGQPIPVKKQDKYNVSRWAVSGRDDIGINTRCWRLYEWLRREQHADADADPERWRELCELWASDFRTHITQARWEAYQERLAATEREWLAPHGDASPGCLRTEFEAPARDPSMPSEGAAPSPGAERSTEATKPLAKAESASRDGDSLVLRAGALTLCLNLRRGMAITAFSDARVAARPLLGTLEHGYFATIDLGADFYSGHLVQESPLTHKITDLERVQPTVGHDGQGCLCARARIVTELGPIDKAVRLDPTGRGFELEWALHWRELPLGSLRLGHVTLLPEAFQAHTLWYATHNGGAELERHRVAGPGFDHGAAVSALVSCRQGLGMSEGVVLLGDARRTIRVEVDQACARPLGLVGWVPAGDRWFLRLGFSLTESDETRRGGIPCDPARPQRMRLRICAERTPPAAPPSPPAARRQVA